MQKVNKHTILKTARDKGYWCGYAAGNKVNEYHITGGWYLGIDVCITAEKINNKWVYYCNTELLETYENSILYYLPRELGTRVAYWNGNNSGMAVYSDGE